MYYVGEFFHNGRVHVVLLKNKHIQYISHTYEYVDYIFIKIFQGLCSWLHSQTVRRGVGVGFEEPHLRLMV